MSVVLREHCGTSTAQLSANGAVRPPLAGQVESTCDWNFSGMESPMPTTKCKIHVVDSDAQNRRSTAQTLRARNWICKTYATAEDMLMAVTSESRGCIMTDLRLPGMSGLDLLRELHHREIHLPLIAVTGRHDTRLAVEAMKKGAVTVLIKTGGDRKLTEAVRLALDLEATSHRNVSKLAKAQVGFTSLTDTERTILKLIADGVPNKQIADECGMGLRTIESRRRSIFQKMQVESLAELVRLVVLMENTTRERNNQRGPR